MSPIISRRVEREDSEEIIEARLSALYSVFFMTISCLIQLSFFVSGAKIQAACAILRHRLYYFYFFIKFVKYSGLF